jgi:beta-glucosidase
MEYFDDRFKAFAQLGWNLDIEKNIPRAVNAARNSDVIIAVMGMYENENWDRATLDLADEQEKMIKALANLDKPMVVVLQHGTVITTHDWIHKVDAVMVSWYPGCEGGNAIAQTIFGDNNPGGKLPVTYPKITGQVPINFNRLPKGKKQIKFIGEFNEPEFCFGHGLSYTQFAYSNLSLSSSEIQKDDTLELSFTVKNTGDRAGDEVPQLYIHDTYASVTQPIKRLRDFERISLKPGQNKEVTFTLTPDNLKIWDENMEHVVEPGKFEIMIGSSSKDIRLEDNFTVME